MRKIITSAAVAAAAAALLGGTGLAAASSHAATSGTEHLQLMSTSATSNKSSVVAYGVFTAGGVDVSGNHNTDTVTFPNGSFKLVHKQTGGSQHFNTKTCLLTGSQTATYTISNGTGAYAGISGSGKAAVSILAVGARNSTGACSKTLPPPAFHLVINASGPVSLP